VITTRPYSSQRGRASGTLTQPLVVIWLWQALLVIGLLFYYRELEFAIP